VFWILGLSSSINTLPVSSGSATDILVAVAATFFLFLAMFVGKKHTLERWQGVILLVGYFGYLIWLVSGGTIA
jgi:cation:H+ antiporter